MTNTLEKPLNRRNFMKMAGIAALSLSATFASSTAQSATVPEEVKQRALSRINTEQLTGLRAGYFDDNNQFKTTTFDPEHIGDRYSVVFFGFQNCPYYCPISLRNISKGLQALDKANNPYIRDITSIMASTDPKRDSVEGFEDYFANKLPKRTKDLTSHEAKNFVGLTALTASELPAYQQGYALPADAQKRLQIRDNAQNTFEASYNMAMHGSEHADKGHHLPAVYVMNPEGRYIGTIDAFNSSPTEITNKVSGLVIKDLLQNKRTAPTADNAPLFD